MRPRLMPRAGTPRLADGAGAAQERAVAAEHAHEIGPLGAGRRDFVTVLRAGIPGIDAVGLAPGVRSLEDGARFGVVGIEGEADASQLHQGSTGALAALDQPRQRVDASAERGQLGRHVARCRPRSRRRRTTGRARPR